MTMVKHVQGKERTTIRRETIAGLLAAVMAFGSLAAPMLYPQQAQAQNLFAPRLYVNNQVITEFEVRQRAMFLQVLNSPGDLEAEALRTLIEDRLRLTEAAKYDVVLSDEDLRKGMEEFASRANLTADQLIAELGKAGIAAETYRDFVRAGAVWRTIVRGKFQNNVPISEADVDKYLDANIRPRALKVRVSELVIPAEPGKEQEAMALAEQLSKQIKSEGQFAAAAQKYSAAPTAPNGGRIPDWLPLANLPSTISGQLLALGNGGVTAPISVPNAVVLFQLHGIERDTKAEPIAVKVEWADFMLPNDGETLARIKANADTCLDLYGQAEGLPPEQLQIRKQSIGEVSPEVALTLAKLDLNETAVLPRSDGNLRLIMLCKREPVMEKEPDRNRIKEIVLNQKLDGLAANYLEELRNAALIRKP